MTKALGAKYISLWPSRASEGRGGGWWDSLQHQAWERGRNGGRLWQRQCLGGWSWETRRRNLEKGRENAEERRAAGEGSRLLGSAVSSKCSSPLCQGQTWGLSHGTFSIPCPGKLCISLHCLEVRHPTRGLHTVGCSRKMVK